MSSLIRSKIEKGTSSKRIADHDALALFASDDLLAIGELAALVNRRKHGKKVYFNINRHINYTNICVNRCTFCAFSSTADEAGSYTLDLEEIRRRAAEARTSGATELHMVGGLHPDLPFDFYLEMLAAIPEARRNCTSRPSPPWRSITSPELTADCRSERNPQPSARCRSRFTTRGRGGNFQEKVREQLCPEKISGQKWLSIMEQVHQAGIKSNATMLYGHLESFADRIDHMRRLRELQDRTGGFQVFIPLAFQPENSPLTLTKSTGTSGVDDLKTLAIARIYLDNFANIKGYWVMLGEKIAQVALAFGVNDLDGTVVEEKIGHDAGAMSPQAMSRDGIIGLIRKAGREPIERDTLYNELRTY